jgi:hypothetical protein
MIRRKVDDALDARLRSARHTASDHMDRGLLPRKVAPADVMGSAGTAGTVLVVGSDGYPGWGAYADSAWRTLLHSPSVCAAGVTAATYFVIHGGLAATATGGTVPLYYIDDADYTVSGKTTVMRVKAAAMTNGASPAVTFTFGLYPVTSGGGGAGSLTYTVGTVVASSTVALTPTGTTQAQGTGEFSVPADGYYALGVVVSGTAAANSYTDMTAVLQVKHT